MKLAQLRQNRRFLLVLPVIALPFVCFVFFNLGGGSGPSKPKGIDSLGLNTQLPGPAVDPAKAFENKLKAYQLADNDSARKAQFQRQDPYRRDMPGVSTHGPLAASTTSLKHLPPPVDNRADRLLQQLDQLKQSLRNPTVARRQPALLSPLEVPVPAVPDPQMDRLNVLLDKLIRIQHPGVAPPVLDAPAVVAVDGVGPADTMANSLRVTIPEDQTLTNGATIALRLIDSIRVEGRVLSPGRLVFGTASFNNDRLLIHVNSLREDADLYTVDWQVYDLDGLQGIHMPALLGRDVAKQSADQGIGSLNVLSADPSLGAQAAGAGIQAAKSFLSHKVRQVRVTVKAGYQLLLRPSRESSRKRPAGSHRVLPVRVPPAPDFPPDGPVLAKASNGRVELVLRDIRIKDSCLWFGLEWKNRSAIGYAPAYARWCIRSRGGMKRMAMQEETVEPLTSTILPVVEAGAVRYSWWGFRPFALSKEKQLMLLVSEQTGDRVLTLTINPHHLLNAKTDVTISNPASEEADNGELH